MNTETMVLSKGSHKSAEEGMCIMEAVAYIAGEPHSDHPTCACPVLTSYMIDINDAMTEKERKQLVPFVKRLVNTRDEKSLLRSNILVRCTLVEIVPHALSITGITELKKHADIMRALPEGDWASAASAARAAAGYGANSAAYAKSAAEYAAAEYAVSAAKYAAWAADAAASAEYADRQVYWDMCLNALNRALEV